MVSNMILTLAGGNFVNLAEGAAGGGQEELAGRKVSPPDFAGTEVGRE